MCFLRCIAQTCPRCKRGLVEVDPSYVRMTTGIGRSIRSFLRLPIGRQVQDDNRKKGTEGDPSYIRMTLPEKGHTHLFVIPVSPFCHPEHKKDLNKKQVEDFHWGGRPLHFLKKV